MSLDTLRRMDIISDTLCQAVDSAEFCRNAHSDESFVQAAEEAVQTMTEYVSSASGSWVEQCQWMLGQGVPSG